MNQVSASSQVIQPSSVFPLDKTEGPDRFSLQYSPSFKCFVFLTSNPSFTVINVNSNVKYSTPIDKQLLPATLSLHPEKNIVALGFRMYYHDYERRIPTHVEILKIPKDFSESHAIDFQSTLFVKPHLFDSRIVSMKFYPDGSRLAVAYANERRGSWCTIYTLPESWESDCSEWSQERWSVPVNTEALTNVTVDVFKQGFPTVDEKELRLNDQDLSSEEYFQIYNERYYSSNLDGGFYCLAISPDTTRLLAGTNDGEIYVIDSTTLKVICCARAYGYCKTVVGCDYNPTFDNEEFAVCNEMGKFDIWNVTVLDDGSEKASEVIQLQFSPGTSNCMYSPDGKLIALTSAAENKTYIISSISGDVMFTLLYQEIRSESEFETCFLASSLFFGSLCQVATLYNDGTICFWKLPLIYTLKTLCLILLRATIKYTDIDEKLCLPSSLKKSLKHLYV